MELNIAIAREGRERHQAERSRQAEEHMRQQEHSSRPSNTQLQSAHRRGVITQRPLGSRWWEEASLPSFRRQDLGAAQRLGLRTAPPRNLRSVRNQAPRNVRSSRNTTTENPVLVDVNPWNQPPRNTTTVFQGPRLSTTELLARNITPRNSTPPTSTSIGPTPPRASYSSVPIEDKEKEDQDQEEEVEEEEQTPPDCAICRESCTITTLATTKPCNHSCFDKTCLTAWLKEHHTCPMCRTPITGIYHQGQEIPLLELRPIPQILNEGDIQLQFVVSV